MAATEILGKLFGALKNASKRETSKITKDFFRRDDVVGITCSNATERINHPDLIPKFKINKKADANISYVGIKNEDGNYDIIPTDFLFKGRKLGPGIHDYGGEKELFSSDFNPSRNTGDVHSIIPATISPEGKIITQGRYKTEGSGSKMGNSSSNTKTTPSTPSEPVKIETPKKGASSSGAEAPSAPSDESVEITPPAGKPVQVPSAQVPPTKTMPSADLGLTSPDMPGEVNIGEFKTNAKGDIVTPPSGVPVKVTPQEAPPPASTNLSFPQRISQGFGKVKEKIETGIESGVDATLDAYEAITKEGRAAALFGKAKRGAQKTIEKFQNHEVELTDFQKETAASLEGFEGLKEAPAKDFKFGDAKAVHAKNAYQETQNFSQQLAGAKNQEEYLALLKENSIEKADNAKDALTQFQKTRYEADPGFGDYFEAYHGHAAIAVGAIGMGAIKAFDNGGARTNAQLYGQV